MTSGKLVGHLQDEFRFLCRLLTQPSEIGAIAPSSKALGRAMAREVDPAQTGLVLELGPGTGIVTAALVARGVSPRRIIAVEHDMKLADLVEKRFPQVHVIRGDAFELSQTLGDECRAPFAAIVSSLPLRNQPMLRRQALVEGCMRHLAPGAPFVQFSYGFKPPVPATKDIYVARAARVLANLPPARVWVYRRK